MNPRKVALIKFSGCHKICPSPKKLFAVAFSIVFTKCIVRATRTHHRKTSLFLNIVGQILRLKKGSSHLCFATIDTLMKKSTNCSYQTCPQTVRMAPYFESYTTFLIRLKDILLSEK